jgi:hypothetical protein
MGPDAVTENVSLPGAGFFYDMFNFADHLAFLIPLNGALANRKEVFKTRQLRTNEPILIPDWKVSKNII